MRLDPVGRLLKLPPALTRTGPRHEGIPVRMRDGAILRADHYGRPWTPSCPRCWCARRTAGARRQPACRAVAQRGFNVLIQSCRGPPTPAARSSRCSRSGRRPRHPRLVAAAAVVRGRLLTYGPSYVGFVQWALAAEAGDELKAMATIVTASTSARRPTPAARSPSTPCSPGRRSSTRSAGPRLENAVELLRASRGCSAGSPGTPRRGRPDHHRRGDRVLPAVARRGRPDLRVLDPARPHPQPAEGHRAGAHDRRLARHLPAVAAGRLRRAAGGGPPAAPDRRPVAPRQRRAVPALRGRGRRLVPGPHRRPRT